jgi:PIN domain nuclease of toxin-antitoxin system
VGELREGAAASYATAPHAVLLDTCALIWLATGEPLRGSALNAIVQAGLADGIFVSPVSAWEVGLLSRPKPGRSWPLQFLPDPKTWFARVLAGPGIRNAPLTPEIAIDSSFLPGDFHGDPADRLIIATARHLAAPIVTRDRRIIDYSVGDHVQVIPC